MDEKVWVGLDIGSVSINIALINGEREVIKDYYVRIEGEPIRKCHQWLGDVFSAYTNIAGLGVTGSGGKVVARILNIPFINEIIAQTKATGLVLPEVKTIIEIGGEDSKLILTGYDQNLGMHIMRDFSMNTICAAGTGSFLDQQASRLGLTIEEFSELALRSEKPPRIAGRCSVFAKTDMIHLQQEATPDYDIVAGLCYALARNFKSSIAKGKSILKPVSFQGGVAVNRGMIRAFEDVLGLKRGELIIPKYHASMGAIGVALSIMEKGEGSTFNSLQELQAYLRKEKDGAKGLASLEIPSSASTSRQWSDSPELDASHPTGVYLGIDVGSISTNVIAIDEQKKLVAWRYLMTAGRPIDAVRKGIEEMADEIGEKVEVKGVGTTGSGRYMIGDLVGADVIKNEITAQAMASIEVDPNVDTIFEIGGQDSKYISLKNGAVCDFEMNKVCAAGTGSFLEEQAERLRLNIKEEFGECALAAKCPVQLGERCTVFMETDLVNHQQKGTGKEDLVAGLAYSIVYNYLNRVVGDKRIGNNIFFQGAVAHNKGVVSAFEKVVGQRITVPPHNDVTGAIGVAIIAMEHMKKNGLKQSSFKGFELGKKPYKITSFECKDCPNLCEIKQVDVEGEPSLYYGSRCEKYEVKKDKDGKGLPDLFAERERLLLRALKEKSVHPISGTKIGIPRAMLFHELMPLWTTFFRELGFEVILSDRTTKKIIHRGVESVISEHCFPIKVSHGHVLNLVEKGVDYIFFPSIINMPKEDHRIAQSYACPFVQAVPYVVKAALEEECGDVEFLVPVVYFTRGERHLVSELGKLGKKLGCSKREVRRATERGLEAQSQFFTAIKKRGREILSSLSGKAMVIVGRPYNTCDSGLNLGIPSKLLDMGVLPIPMDFLPIEDVALGDEWTNMYWRYGQRILSSLRVMKRNPSLYPVYITNFGCGPDSFILKYFSKEMGRKPYLAIEVDEHSAPAGVITRLEAFLDSLENIGGATDEKISSGRSLEDFSNRTLYIPYMGNHAHVVAAAFRRCGVRSEVIPVADEQSLELGRKYTTGKECYPCILTTGDMIKLLRENPSDREEIAFFMPQASGPCRFGQYSKLQRMILDDLGYSDVPIVSPNQAAKFYQTLTVYGKGFDKVAWMGVCAVDVLDKLLRETRPYEVNEGETDEVYQRCLDKMVEAVEFGEVEGILPEVEEGFEKIAVDKSTLRPVIGIVGEIYVRSHHFANNDVVRTVEELGGEAWLPTIAEWFFYTNFRRKEDDLVRRDYKAFLLDWAKDRWQRRVEHRIHGALKNGLRNLHEPPIVRIFEHSNPFLHRTVEGEGVLSVGKAIDFVLKGASGIINVMPFTCMPGTNVAAVMLRVKEKWGDFPFLNMAYDGLEQTTARTRLEAFMHQAQQYMLQKIESH